ncbi:MAG: DUF1667 domain-containing protein [Lachnospiraceae bacterium]|nr:DUF1667 domain-containing protein [Lachnospiraceae bacterium]
MEKRRELICIKCPKGCRIAVAMDGDEVVGVEGNSCPRGEEYVRKEITSPTRMVTSTVRLIGSDMNVMPVRLSGEITKGKIFDVMKEIRKCQVKAPVRMGEVLITDVCGLGVDVVAAAEALDVLG